VAELGDFEGGPMHVWQAADQGRDDGGFADVARMSTDDNDCHG
jgi:hypothetical protein